MENSGLEMLREEKITRNAIEFIWSLDMCYEGQGHYVEVPLARGELGAEVKAEIIKAFHSLHKIKYGHQMDAPPRVINVRLKAIGKIKEMRIREIKQDKSIPLNAIKAKRMVYLDGNFVECEIYDRYELSGGNVINGPAVVEEPFHVTAVMSGQSLTVDKFGNLIINTRGK
jgi:N-methylhydantoinase A/oxoprolinase/acetone carboxylase beta subunit